MSPADTAQTIEQRIGETGSLSVRLADWDVEVIAVDGDVARIRNADGAKLPDGLEIQRHDNGIAIRQPNRSALDLLSGRRSSATRISIEIPTRATASIQTASGDVQATGLRGPVETRTASGDVLLVDVAGEVQVETVSGDAAIRLAGRTTLAVKTVSGDCIIEGGEVDRLAFATTSGDMWITSELGDGPHADRNCQRRRGRHDPERHPDLGPDRNRGPRQRPAAHVRGTTRPPLAGHRRGLDRGPVPVGLGRPPGRRPERRRAPEGDPAAAVPPAPPTPPAVPAFVATASAADAGTEFDPAADAAEPDEPSNQAVRLDILRGLERGEMDIEEAEAKLSALDGQTDG